MAPEQFDDAHEIDPAADVFALGRIFYHMLTGKCPFPYSPPEKLSPEFRFLVSKATAEKPGDRYATVAEFGRQVALIVSSNEALTSPMERSKELLAHALRGDEGARDELLSIILANSDDEVFFSGFVPKLPPPILVAFQAANPIAFSEIVRRFDEYSDASHPFNYVDVIADFFANVFRITADPMLRVLALRRIMIVGERHNRFYVGGVFARLVSGLKDPHDILLAVNVMRDDPDVARWYRSYLQLHSLPRAIRSLVEEAS